MLYSLMHSRSVSTVEEVAHKTVSRTAKRCFNVIRMPTPVVMPRPAGTSESETASRAEAARPAGRVTEVMAGAKCYALCNGR